MDEIRYNNIKQPNYLLVAEVGPLRLGLRKGLKMSLFKTLSLNVSIYRLVQWERFTSESMLIGVPNSVRGTAVCIYMRWCMHAML